MRDIKTIVTDVDGIFTDGTFYYSEHGKMLKKFAPHDADGIKLLKQMGINIIAISADIRGWPITQARFKDMNIELLQISEYDRHDWFIKNFSLETTGFVGDGIWDARILNSVYFGFSPANATKFALKAAKFPLKTYGGSGVFLEIFEIIANHFPDKKKLVPEINL